ncbi:hypothetical protein GCM10010495_59360 [Kitasatospora herbaricolor]|nr:hypothetical protein GCM10010495_59360 [Kitasatospora herbaricolor]
MCRTRLGPPHLTRLSPAAGTLGLGAALYLLNNDRPAALPHRPSGRPAVDRTPGAHAYARGTPGTPGASAPAAALPPAGPLLR